MKVVLNLGVIQVLAWVSPWCIVFVYKGPWCHGFESQWEPRFLETLSPKQSLYIKVIDLNYSFKSSISKDRTGPVRFLRVSYPEKPFSFTQFNELKNLYVKCWFVKLCNVVSNCII